jgi:hypothetical protein
VKLIQLAAVILWGAMGCTRQPEPAKHSVADYRADRALRQEVFKRCVNDPGTLAQTPDCINATEAERLESIGSLRESRPLGLDDKKRP